MWWGQWRERWAEASRPRPGHGTSVGLGTGIDPLGGSARARIASCHNNLLLSSRLIDGAELAPHDAPGAPSLPEPAGPQPFSGPVGFSAALAPSSSRPDSTPGPARVLWPALCLLFPCPRVSVSLTVPHCPSCLPSWAFDPVCLFLIFSDPRSPTSPPFLSPFPHHLIPCSSLFLCVSPPSTCASAMPSLCFSPHPCPSAPLPQVVLLHLHFCPLFSGFPSL